MIRKLLVVAAAIAMPVSAIAVTGVMASASSPHSAATDTIVCKDISGTVTFSPKEDKTGYTNLADQVDGHCQADRLQGIRRARTRR